MNFPIKSLGELSALTNAIADELKIDVKDLNLKSMSEVNQALVRIGFGYSSTNSLGDMCNQIENMIEEMNLDAKSKEKIFKKADDYYLKLQNK